jgi:hypothetical protein
MYKLSATEALNLRDGYSWQDTPLLIKKMYTGFQIISDIGNDGVHYSTLKQNR